MFGCGVLFSLRFQASIIKELAELGQATVHSHTYLGFVLTVQDRVSNDATIHSRLTLQKQSPFLNKSFSDFGISKWQKKRHNHLII